MLIQITSITFRKCLSNPIFFFTATQNRGFFLVIPLKRLLLCVWTNRHRVDLVNKPRRAPFNTNLHSTWVALKAFSPWSLSKYMFVCVKNLAGCSLIFFCEGNSCVILSIFIVSFLRHQNKSLILGYQGPAVGIGIHGPQHLDAAGDAFVPRCLPHRGQAPLVEALEPITPTPHLQHFTSNSSGLTSIPPPPPRRLFWRSDVTVCKRNSLDKGATIPDLVVQPKGGGQYRMGGGLSVPVGWYIPSNPSF